MWKVVLLCFLACEGVLADVGSTQQALVPDTLAVNSAPASDAVPAAPASDAVPAAPAAQQVAVASDTPLNGDMNALLQGAETKSTPQTFAAFVFVAMAASGMYMWNQASSGNSGGGASSPFTSVLTQLAGSDADDAQRYGQCYVLFEHDTQPGVCGVPGDTAVTEVFANVLRDETHMLAKGFAPQMARKGMLYAGLGIKKGLNEVLKHLIKRAQAQTTFECDVKGSQCVAEAVEESTIPAEVGWNKDCANNLLNDAKFGAEYGLQRRLQQVAHGYRNTENELFWGKDRLVGAAVVVCVGVALHGDGFQEELAKTNCACDGRRDASDEEDYDCDDGIDTTCVIARYNPDSIKVQREISLEQDLEEEGERVTMAQRKALADKVEKGTKYRAGRYAKGEKARLAAPESRSRGHKNKRSTKQDAVRKNTTPVKGGGDELGDGSLSVVDKSVSIKAGDEYNDGSGSVVEKSVSVEAGDEFNDGSGSVVEKSLVDKSVQVSDVERSVVEDSVVEKSVVEDSVVEQSVVEDSVVEQSVVEDSVVENNGDSEYY